MNEVGVVDSRNFVCAEEMSRGDQIQSLLSQEASENVAKSDFEKSAIDENRSFSRTAEQN